MRVIAKTAGLALIDRPVRLPNAGAPWVVNAADGLLRRLTHLGFWPGRAGDLDAITRMLVEVRSRLGPEHLYRADERRRQSIAATAELFRDVDVLFTPATAMTAPPAIGPAPETIGGRNARLSGPAPFTVFVNFAWNPAIAVPTGMHSNGLPMSLQIVGQRHRDEVPLRLARVLELERPWQRRPVVVEETDPGSFEDGLPVPMELVEKFFAWSLDLSHDATAFDDFIAELTPVLLEQLSGSGSRPQESI